VRINDLATKTIVKLADYRQSMKDLVIRMP